LPPAGSVTESSIPKALYPAPVFFEDQRLVRRTEHPSNKMFGTAKQLLPLTNIRPSLKGRLHHESGARDKRLRDLRKPETDNAFV
jgi:hypothetical protein